MRSRWGVLAVAVVLLLSRTGAAQGLVQITPPGGTVVAPFNVLNVSGTLASGVNDQYGTYFNLTGSGNGAGSPYAMRAELQAGYTGPGASFAFRAVNSTVGSGVNWDHGTAAVDGVSHGFGATYNIGVRGRARWGTAGNIGVFGVGSNTSGLITTTGQTYVGVYGRAQTDVTGIQIGGAFTVGSTDLPFSKSTVLLLDNLGTTAPLLTTQVNGVAAFQIDSAGHVGFNGATPIAPPVIIGSRGGNAALASLLTALASVGLVVDQTTPQE